MMNNKISVIVPVFNVEEYLSACIESLINQSYKNLEIILIDDGSTDSCPQICDDYALKDNRLKVIHKNNGGLSDARNAGLKKATGDFISFIDGDDLLSINFYQKLLEILIENNADIVECSFTKFEKPLELEKIISPLNDKIEIINTENALELLMKEYFKQVVWNKIYRKEVLSNIQFPVGKINEDEYWTYKVFGNSKQIVKIPDILHFYRQQPASIMGKGYSLRRLDGLEALEQRIAYMNENFPKLENLAIKIFCGGSLWHYQQVYTNSEIDPEGMNRRKIIEKVKVYNKLSIFKQWNVKEIFWYQFFIIAPNFCVKFRNLFKFGI